MQSKSSKELVTPENRTCFIESSLTLILDETLVPSFEDPATEFLSTVFVEGNFSSFSFQAGVPLNFLFFDANGIIKVFYESKKLLYYTCMNTGMYDIV